MHESVKLASERATEVRILPLALLRQLADQCKLADVAQLAERSLGKTEVSSSILDIGSE